MSGKTSFLLAIVLILLFSLPVYGEGDSLFFKVGIQPIKDKRKAPDFSLEALNGERIQLKALKGKIIFLNFWATWCRPCKEEMPSIEALWQQSKEKDFIFLTICVDYAGAKGVREFIGKYGYRFPVLLDPAGKSLDLFEINRIPATLMIDKHGRMVGRVIGPRDWSSPEVVSLLDQMLSDRTKTVVFLRD